MALRTIGLQAKAILVLTVVVLAAGAASGWLYCTATAAILRQNDRRQAQSLASGLALAAGPSLTFDDRRSLQRLAREQLSHADVHCVYILDRNGKVVAEAKRTDPDGRRYRIGSLPPSLSYEIRRAPDFLETGRPILVSGGGSRRDLLAGAVRVVMDTRDTANVLAGLEREVILIVLAIVLCVIPLGYLLVWRVMVVPIRRLLRATCQLARGDFSVRVETRRGDEIGELANSFDAMAESLHASQLRLRQAKESLERKVTERTAELQEANRRLREEMAEKEDFLQAVSHDLNAPLRNIAGMASMIAAKWRDQLPRDGLARLRRIQANVEVETGLINELLELSRIKTRSEARSLVDFDSLLTGLRDSFEYELRARNIELTIHRPMPQLYVERNRLRQAFQNLIDNAIKYMSDRPDGRIEIGYSRENGMHQFCVWDNGPGIDPDDQERIFYVFRRAATAAGLSGKGVGLALVKSIVSNYNGRVWVESEPGNGSAFHISLSAECTRGPVERPAPQTDQSKTEGVAVGEHPAGG